MDSLTWIDGWGWGMGQLCALGVHGLAWWLRRKALWELSFVGLLGAVGLWFAVGFLLGIGYWGDVPLSGAQQRELNQRFDTAMAGLFCAASFIGGLHAWQLRPHWRARWRVWLAATLGVFGEALLALVLSGVLSVGCHAALGVTLSSGFWMAFVCTLLTLAIFRPLVLRFTRPLRPMLERTLGLYLVCGTGQRSVEQVGGPEW